MIELIEENPNITHREIAEEIGKSQPAVGARIIKLERKHLLKEQVGFNLKKAKIETVIAFIATKDVDGIIEKIKDTDLINYAFKISGKYNILCFIPGKSLKTIERFIDRYFRDDPNVIKVKTEVIIKSIHDFVIPIFFNDDINSLEPFDEELLKINSLVKEGG
ncbi:MAG: Lrp/AsnC family transcriptional regulator [Promethearchaeota archaeon]|nr:MAG: Lrp/AsnC family transcriptional regulator [Candidatus Lokiarchaeota archaeon]